MSVLFLTADTTSSTCILGLLRLLRSMLSLERAQHLERKKRSYPPFFCRFKRRSAGLALFPVSSQFPNSPSAPYRNAFSSYFFADYNSTPSSYARTGRRPAQNLGVGKRIGKKCEVVKQLQIRSTCRSVSGVPICQIPTWLCTLSGKAAEKSHEHDKREKRKTKHKNTSKESSGDKSLPLSECESEQVFP